jgi:hypothetical protein
VVVKDQVILWLAGISFHNDERSECCPDFSCCSPELLAPFEEREIFTMAFMNEKYQIVDTMLMLFLGRMLKAHNINAYIAGRIDG